MKQPTINEIIERYTPTDEELQAFINIDLGPMDFKIENIDFESVNKIDLGEMTFKVDMPRISTLF